MQAPPQPEPAVYFVREAPARFRPTVHVSGAWDPDEQHIAPPMGLLAHAIETDLAARRGADLRLSRLSYDILGTMPLEPVDVTVEVLRPGRTIELVEARLSHAGRSAVIARAWLTARFPTEAIAGSALPAIRPRAAMARWPIQESWHGGFVRSTQIWRHELAVGRVQFWARSPVLLLADETVSAAAHALRLMDVANGVAARVSPAEVAFPNLDLTVSLFREPTGEPIGFDSTASFGPDGAGLTQSILHDETGPFGAFSLSLTVRPGRPG